MRPIKPLLPDNFFMADLAHFCANRVKFEMTETAVVINGNRQNRNSLLYAKPNISPGCLLQKQRFQLKTFSKFYIHTHAPAHVYYDALYIESLLFFPRL